MARTSRDAFELRTKRRTALLVDLANWDYFHSQMRRIEFDYPLAYDVLDPASPAVKSLRESARESLRAEMRTLTSTGPASYLIAV